MRPGTHHLLRLAESGLFRIGIFTSSTLRTVTVVRQMLERAAGAPFFDENLIFYR